jgi:glycosyltransferase involved in cell wall biosynthesis
MLSIIIPALNEENYLPRLLDCLKKQSFKNYEIIVADADSRDKTREVAQTFGCKIVKGGLPAKGRNEGTKIARGDIILFLDADALLPEDFLEKTLKEFKERNLDIASFVLNPISEKKYPKILFDIFYGGRGPLLCSAGF